MRAFFVSRCSFQFMKLLFFLFFIFQNHSIATQGKKVFFPTFFPGFLEWAFHPGLILKTFSKGKKIIFSLFFCNIDCLWGINFPQHFVPKDPDFFLSPQTFSFAKSFRGQEAWVIVWNKILRENRFSSSARLCYRKREKNITFLPFS